MPRRSILFYYPYNKTFSGGPQTLLNLIASLDRSKIDPVIVSQRESPLTEVLRARGEMVFVEPFPEVLDVYNGRALAYSLLDKTRSFFALVAYNRRLAAHLERYRPGAVWARGAKGVLMTGMAARWRGVPLVWDVGLEKESRGWMQLLNGLGLLLASRVVTQARAQPREIFGAATARLFGYKFRTIYPGISTERVAAIRQSAEARGNGGDAKTRLLVIGSIYPRKNQLMVLRALRGVLEQHPATCLDVVGPVSDEGYQRRLCDFVNAHGLISNVRFLGRRDDVPALLAQSDVLVIGSHAEGLPHVVREAMHAGVPIVGTCVGGIPEAVQHGETGFLVDPDDHRAMTNHLKKLCAHPARRRAMGRKGRSRAREKFSQAAWAASYGKLLRSL